MFSCSVEVHLPLHGFTYTQPDFSTFSSKANFMPYNSLDSLLCYHCFGFYQLTWHALRNSNLCWNPGSNDLKSFYGFRLPDDVRNSKISEPLPYLCFFVRTIQKFRCRTFDRLVPLSDYNRAASTIKKIHDSIESSVLFSFNVWIVIYRVVVLTRLYKSTQSFWIA